MRSIFWKIFLVIWLTSFIIGASSSVLLTREIVQNQIERDWEQTFKSTVQALVSYYENWTKQNPDSPRRARLAQYRPLVIVEESTGEFIAGSFENFPDIEWTPIEFTSKNNNSYEVYIPRNEQANFVHILSVVWRNDPYRFGLSVVVAGLFSLLLSLVVIRPIKNLQKHIEIMGGGDLDIRLGRRLIRRRDEFGQLSRAFNKMADRITSLVNSKQQLLHDVSHELRAPLARLQVAGELARMEAEVAGIGPAMYDRVESECVSLNKLIDEILTLSRAEAGADDDQLEEPCELPEFLNRIVSDARFLHSEREIELQITGKPRQVKIKTVALEKAVKNILENAIKYSPEGIVEVDLEFSRRKVHISVADRGPGMTEDDLQNIFTPFYRVKAYNSKEGYGLGMSITQKSVQQMNGEIYAKNREGGGLKVTIELPA
ncbi:HAMP domain-containing sensor histidine kinase [Porticoccaceae bacterium LTM1]|nr:HAMP domain-containing sensor histidine kinase [Porticoccaceae bacterium LTM1]